MSLSVHGIVTVDLAVSLLRDVQVLGDVGEMLAFVIGADSTGYSA